MDSFEFNKIAGAVLAALLLMFGTPTLIDIVAGGHDDHHAANAGYQLPEAAETAVADTGGDAAKAFEFADVASLLETASADAGAAVFKKCASCHTVNEGGKNGIGPNLWDVVGRGRGVHEGFNYSKALVEKGGIWDYPSLTEFIHKPKTWLSGTKMAFAGLRSEKDLANLMAYLQTLSASPKPFPQVAAAPAETPAEPGTAAPATTTAPTEAVPIQPGPAAGDAAAKPDAGTTPPK